MKYRRLNSEELEGLKDEFVKFMVVHGVDASEWSRLKADEPARAMHWIDVFSDYIFDGIVEKVKYLEFHDNQSIRLFYCTDDIIYLSGIDSDSSYASISLFWEAIKVSPQNFNIFRTSKEYSPDRKTEIFRMIQSGCLVTEGNLWKWLSEE